MTSALRVVWLLAMFVAACGPQSVPGAARAEMDAAAPEAGADAIVAHDAADARRAAPACLVELFARFDGGDAGAPDDARLSWCQYRDAGVYYIQREPRCCDLPSAAVFNEACEILCTVGGFAGGCQGLDERTCEPIPWPPDGG